MSQEIINITNTSTASNDAVFVGVTGQQFSDYVKDNGSQQRQMIHLVAKMASGTSTSAVISSRLSENLQQQATASELTNSLLFDIGIYCEKISAHLQSNNKPQIDNKQTNQTTNISNIAQLDPSAITNILEIGAVFNPAKIKLFEYGFNAIANTIANGMRTLQGAISKDNDTLAATTELLSTLGSLISPDAIETSNKKSLFGLNLVDFSKVSSMWSKKNIKDFEYGFNSILDILTSNLEKFYNLKITKNVNIVLSTIDELMGRIVNISNSRKEIRYLNIFSTSLSNFITSFIRLAQSSKIIQVGANVFNKVIDGVIEKLSDKRALTAGRAMKSIAMGLATLGIAMVAFTVLAPIMIAGAMALKLFSRVLDYAIEGSTVREIGTFALGLATLGIAIWAFGEIVKPESLLPICLGLATLAGALWLFNKGGGKFGNIKTGGAPPVKNVLYAAAGIAAMGLAVWVWDNLGIEYDTVLKLALGMGILAAAVWGYSKLKNNSIKSILGVSLGVATLGIAIWLWEKLDIGYDTITKVALGIGSMAVALMLFGKSKQNAILNMLLVGGAIALFGYAVSMFNGISTEQLIQVGVFSTAMALSTYLYANPIALIGAAVMLVVGGSLIAMGYGMKKVVESGITSNIMDEYMGAVTTLILGYTALAAPAIIAGIASLLLLPVAATTTKLAISINEITKAKYDNRKMEMFVKSVTTLTDFYESLSLWSLTKTMAKAVMLKPMIWVTYSTAKTIDFISKMKMDPRSIENNANSMGLFIETMVQTFANVEDKVWAAKKGIWAVSDLASTVKSLADAVHMAANLEYVETKVINGKIVPIKTRKLGKADFERVGAGIAQLLNSIIDPLIKIGSSEEEYEIGGVKVWNPFASNKVEKGIDALSNIGSIFSPLAALVQSFSNSGVLGKDSDTVIDRMNKSIATIIGSVGNLVKSLANVEIEDPDDIAELIDGVAPIFDPLSSLMEKIANIESSKNKIDISKTIGDVGKAMIAFATDVNGIKNPFSITKMVSSLGSLFEAISNVDATAIRDVRSEIDLMYKMFMDNKPWNTFDKNLMKYTKSFAEIKKQISGIDTARAVIMKDIFKEVNEAGETGDLERLLEKINELIGVIGETRTTTINSPSNNSSNTNNSSITNNQSPATTTNETKHDDSVKETYIIMTQVATELRKLISKFDSPLTVRQKPGDRWSVVTNKI